jgi:hypothetical protein
VLEDVDGKERRRNKYDEIAERALALIMRDDVLMLRPVSIISFTVDNGSYGRGRF